MKIFFWYILLGLSHLNPLSYLSWIYNSWIRVIIKKKYISKKPTISVGNITFGGVGKTPFTLWVVERLLKQTKSVAIINRNYGAKSLQSGLVTQVDLPNLIAFGDEALIYKNHFQKNVSVFSGPNKKESLKLSDQAQFNFDCAIIDDGFQHTEAFRNLNIALVNVSDDFSFGVFPFGRGREWMWSLKRADIVVLTKVNSVSSSFKNQVKSLIRRFVKKSTPIFESHFYEEWPVIDKKRNIIVLSAIADNSYFFARAFQNYGAQVIKTIGFTDHFDFSSSSFKKLKHDLSKDLDNVFLVTEKDALKLKILYPDLPISVVKLSVEVTESEALFGIIDRLFH